MWRASFPGVDISLADEQLRRYGALCIREPELLSRTSRLFLFDMFAMHAVYGIDPQEILASVRDVEAGEGTIGVKPASPFKHEPLRGLWHKHFFAARFLAHNIELGLGKNGLKTIVESVLLPHLGSPATEEMIAEIAHRVTHEPLEQRHAATKMTGEWVVFVKSADRNYYLCVTTHHNSDAEIHRRILDLAAMDFPEVEQWIAEASNKT